jgi:dipeptidyl aminopeptidase/acylaminoacyl peptidase
MTRAGRSVWSLHATTVVDTAGRVRLALPPVTQEYGLNASWSPDGRRVAVADGGALRVVAVDGGAEVARVARPGARSRPDYRAPLWLGGDTLAAAAADTLWRFPLDGGAPAASAAPAGRQLLDVVTPQDARRLDAAGGAALAFLRERATKRIELARVDLRTGAWTTLFALDAAIAAELPYAADVARGGGAVAFVAESGDRPGEVWVAEGDLARPRRLTELNPAVTRVALGRSRLVRWTTARGDTLRGALLLPPGHVDGARHPGARHPLVVRVYGGSALSNTVNRFGLQQGVDNLQLLATRGYAVLLPDTPLRVATPLADLAAAVLPALDTVVAMGVADPARLAVTGHSYGGWSVLALLVQTDRFRAAVSSGGMSDLFHHYAHMRVDGSATAVNWSERDQGRMGGHPWEARDVYLANSPFFHLDRVRTPVLLVHGAADHTVTLAQAEQTFVGLRRLGRPAALVAYAGEGHHPGEWRRANVVDYWERVFAWLDAHLGAARTAERSAVRQAPRPERAAPDVSVLRSGGHRVRRASRGRAGRWQASRATAASSSGTATNVAASVALTS